MYRLRVVVARIEDSRSIFLGEIVEGIQGIFMVEYGGEVRLSQLPMAIFQRHSCYARRKDVGERMRREDWAAERRSSRGL